MAATIKDLGIGTLKNVAAVSEDTPLISVLNIFSERRVSALPVIDSEGTVLDIYVKTDAIMLARDRTYAPQHSLFCYFALPRHSHRGTNGCCNFPQSPAISTPHRTLCRADGICPLALDWIPIDSHPHRYNNLDVSVSAALTARHGRRFDEVQTCLLSDALGDILDRMVNKDLHRLIIVDQHKRLLGVISLSDILTLFIM